MVEFLGNFDGRDTWPTIVVFGRMDKRHPADRVMELIGKSPRGKALGTSALEKLTLELS